LKTEQRIANSLRRHGTKVKISPGSRGSADLISELSSGKTWFVQSKYSGTENLRVFLKEKRKIL